MQTVSLVIAPQRSEGVLSIIDSPWDFGLPIKREVPGQLISKWDN
jgi:hypothetical protein